MNSTLASLDFHAVTRMLLIFSHMICLAIAGGFILLGDYAIFGQKNKINTELLQKSAKSTLLVLVGLWITGSSIIWLDTQFDPAVLMTKDKLLAKLTVAIALSANGWLLHTLAFPSLTRNSHARDALSAATLPAVLGAVSLSSWIYAAFVGEAKAVADFLGYQGFMQLYLAFVVSAIAVSLVTIRPRLAQQMGARASITNDGQNTAAHETRTADTWAKDSKQELSVR